MATRSESIRRGRAEPVVVGEAVRRGLSAVTAVDGSPAQTVVRLTLGVVMLPHGLQKAFGLFGGPGFEGTMGFLTGAIGLPWLVALLVIGIELVGAAALLAGALSRVMAAGIVAVMVGAVVTSHLPYGFFMNWSGTAGGEGFEFHLLAIGMGIALMLRGGGAAAVDGLLHRRLAER